MNLYIMNFYKLNKKILHLKTHFKMMLMLLITSTSKKNRKLRKIKKNLIKLKKSRGSNL